MKRQSPKRSLIGSLQFLDVYRLETFGSLFRIEADLVPFRQAFKAASVDGRVMDENVRPVVSRDKAEPLAVIEPFHRSLSHFLSSPFLSKRLVKKKPQSQKSLWRLKQKLPISTAKLSISSSEGQGVLEKNCDFSHDFLKVDLFH